MSEVQKMGFGFQDDNDSSLKGKSMDGVFGLNQNVHLVNFAYNANAGKDDSEANAIDITVKIGESEQRRRIYEITKVYKDKTEITDTSSDDFINGYNEQWQQDNAMITHVLKCFVSEETIKQALSQPLSSFADWAKVVTALVPQNFESQPLDVALEYQWNIPEGKDQSYLQLPKNMKGGKWLVKAQPGNFKPVEKEDGSLTYVNEQGTVHPITRDKAFMTSNKAKRQHVNDALNSASQGGANTPAKSPNW